MATNPEMTIELVHRALCSARLFISNGVELGYIRMPDPGLRDSAHDTLPLVEQALSALSDPAQAPASALVVDKYGDDIVTRLRSQAAHDGKTFPSGGTAPDALMAALLREAADVIVALRGSQAPASEAEGWRKLLFDLIVAWDADDDMGILEHVFKARRALGLKLANADEEAKDEEVLRANGLLDDEPGVAR